VHVSDQLYTDTPNFGAAVQCRAAQADVVKEHRWHPTIYSQIIKSESPNQKAWLDR